jgi:hypothetical protein
VPAQYAIVDVIADTTDSFLSNQGCTVIDAADRRGGGGPSLQAMGRPGIAVAGNTPRALPRLA